MASSSVFSRALLAMACCACIGLSMAATPAFSATSAAGAQKNLDAQVRAGVAKMENDPFFKELDTMAADHNAPEVSGYINKRVQANEKLLSIALHWLEMRGMHWPDRADYDGNYLILYSDYLHSLGDSLMKSGNKKNADIMLKNSLLALMSAEAVLMADAKRCEDRSVMSVLRGRMMAPRFDSLKDAYGLIPEKAYEDMSRAALQEEEQHGKRPPNIDLCMLGADAMNDMMSQKNMKKEVVKDPSAPGGKKVRMTLPEGYKFQPKTVPDGQWLAWREDIRNYLRTDWPNRYKIYRKAAGAGGFSGQSGSAATSGGKK
ncbi:MAG: hypothetical protein GC185_02175 [Alphaproteobacteria bacterium]|nr:hypothetical protein [Alphaproteobacteria bacterium]